MIDPVTALLSGTVVFGVLAYLFFPEKGLLAKLNRKSQDTQKILIEDALKHIFDSEDKSEICNTGTLVSRLSITKEKAAELINILDSMQLISVNGSGFQLTQEGRDYALRVIRIHRLLERYLADETSTHANDWHVEAERMEHDFAPEEVETLAAQLGNPVVDPHGDPIPTANGQLPKMEGITLDKMESGKVGKIVHIEDEPPTIYKQLNAIGLFKWMQIHVVENDGNKIRFYANGDVNVLAPEFAQNVTIRIIENTEEIVDNFRRLSSAKVGEPVKIKSLGRGLRGKQRRRLMDLGMVPGTVVTAELVSRSGDPTAYKVRGASIALRQEQSDLIYIEDAKGDNDE